MASPTQQPPPEPVYILRGHPSQVHALQFCRGNRRLVSGDADGWVVLWSVSSRRPVVSWKAHEGAVLGIKEWGAGKIITHGRDNKLFVWKLAEEDEALLDKLLPTDVDEYKLPSCRNPWQLNSLDCNSLNFCGFAMCAEEEGAAVSSEKPVLIAIPSLMDSDKIDIWRLPNSERIHSAIGASNTKTGMAMGLELFHLNGSLNVAAGFESGHVCLFRHEQGAWSSVFVVQPHTQPSLSIAVSSDHSFLVSSSADAIICKIGIPDPLSKGNGNSESQIATKKRDTQHSGQQSIRIRGDGKILATAGWDSKVRVYSVKTLKELAVLKWHRVGCYAVAFAAVKDNNQEKAGETVGSGGTALVEAAAGEVAYKTLEQRREEREASKHWIAAGAKDGKISLWDIY